MAFSFRVLMISTVEDTAPSATFSMLLAYWALAMSCSSPLICTRIRSEMA